jgi:signal transduction histidine kinase
MRIAAMREIEGLQARSVEPDPRTVSRTTDFTDAGGQQRSLQDELAADLLDLTRLNDLSTRLWAITELSAILEEAVTGTIEIQRADFGTAQLRDPESHTLRIAARRGFSAEILEYFVDDDYPSSACDRALQTGARIVIEDVQTDPLFAPRRHIAAAAGFRAVQSAPLCNREGRLIGVISTYFKQPHRPSERELRLTDLYTRQAAEMIERKRADDERAKLMAHIDRLTHASRVMSIDVLTTSIAHEISQPLSGVLSNGNACISWLNRVAPNLQEACAAAQHIIRDAHRINDVVRSIRTLARQIPPDMRRLDVTSIVREVISMLEEPLLSNGIEITVISPAAIFVMVDAVQLQQVLVNLVVNAIEAMRPVNERQRRLTIDCRLDTENRVTVSVRDNGIGMEQYVVDRLFDTFFSTKPDGMGLGLSISRSIIQAHGGELYATRNQAYGLTMTFWLPMQIP